jgi:hypothetical protein
MRIVAPFILLVAAATAAPREYPPTQGAGACDVVRTNSTVELEDAVSSLLAHTTASGDFPKALAALLANATGNSGSAMPEGGADSSTDAPDDSSTPPEVAGGGPEVSASDSGRRPALMRGVAWLRGSVGASDDASDDVFEDASEDAPDNPIYDASRRPATQDHPALSPAAAGRAAVTGGTRSGISGSPPAEGGSASRGGARGGVGGGAGGGVSGGASGSSSVEGSGSTGGGSGRATGGTANAPSPAQVAAGSREALQSAEHGVNVANDIVRGGSGGVSDAIRDGARATANGANAAAAAGPPPSAGGGSSRGTAGGPPSLPRLSPADVAAGANAVAGGAGLASAIGNIAGDAPRPSPPGLGSLGGLRGIDGGRGPLVGGGPPGLGRLPGGFRRLGGGLPGALRKRQSAQA